LLSPIYNILTCAYLFAILQVAYDQLGIDTAESKVNFDAQLAQSVLDAGDMRAQLAESAVAAGGMRAQLAKSVLDAGDMRAQLDKSELDSGVMKVEQSASSHV
jgi:hypothetical protein